MNWNVPFFDLQLGDEEKNAIIATLESNWITTGPRIATFEKDFVSTIGCGGIGVSVSSATAALHLSLLAMEIGPGDEVIVPSLTFVASANVIRYVGAKPVFADITSKENWNISVKDIKKKVTPRTRAIIAVHYAGYACNMTAIKNLAEKSKIKIIEDCSHAPLAKHQKKHVGTFGESGCFSFFSNKNITTAEGGMVLTQSSKFANRIKMLRSHGITSSTYHRFKGHAFGYDVAELGFNYRLDEIRASLGSAQIKKLKHYNALRKQIVLRYRSKISKHIPEVIVPFENFNEESSYHIFPVLIPVDAEKRDAIAYEMSKAGIQCSIHYRPIHTFTSYKKFSAIVPKTDEIAGSILTLPLFPGMSTNQINLVIKSLKKCLQN